MHIDQVMEVQLCNVTWFCYQLIAKPGNKTAAPPWPDLYLASSIRYGVSVVSDFEKMNCVITALHCILLGFFVNMPHQLMCWRYTCIFCIKDNTLICIKWSVCLLFSEHCTWWESERPWLLSWWPTSSELWNWQCPEGMGHCIRHQHTCQFWKNI